ncbi:MAG: hypothetical protein SNJ59_01030 [Aggregatilineales bacterium]
MRTFIVTVGVLLLLAAGGGLTALLITSQGSGLIPILQQTAVPDASVSQVAPWQAEQFFLLIAFVLFNLIGIGLTIALLFWLLDRGIRRSKVEAEQAAKSEIAVEN